MEKQSAVAQEHLDVLVVGSGLSGIDIGYHLQKRCPDRTFAIFEARNRIGGTWDLFRYPGVRSDSDMHTLGFPFRPWQGEKVILEGAQILQYLEDTAQELGITPRIRLRHRVLAAQWRSDESRWTVEYESEGRRAQITCHFLFMASGYYDYQGGYLPDFPGIQDFRGRLIHPQQWPEDLNYAHQRLLVIGSGATAITLVPALAKQAARVTMLQRSPSYIVTLPAHDTLSSFAFRFLPCWLAGQLARWKNLGLSMFLYQLSRKRPEETRRKILDAVRRQLPGFADMECHFSPTYNPWDQRMCVAPDGDFFAALRSGKVEIVTDTIRTFISSGLLLESGRQLDADIVVTATGLRLQLLGNVKLTVDGTRVDPANHTIYRGMMVSGVPNLVLAFGYTNASWTLRVDLVSRFFCRLLNHLKRTRMIAFRPQPPDSGMELQPMLNLTSGYIRRSLAQLPRQGSKDPWRVHQNYLLDLASLRWSSIQDGVLQFSPAEQRKACN